MARPGKNILIRFFAWVLLAWIFSWLPLGLYHRDFDFVLTPVSRGSWARQLYQILFYGSIFLIFLQCWRQRNWSRPGWGKAKDFLIYFVQGLLAAAFLRVILQSFGYCEWTVAEASAGFISQVVVSTLAVALIEEALFRGLILGALSQSFGWPKAAFATSALFSVVHLFRPGPFLFKLSYGLALFILGYLLACLAWHHDSILASAGFHAGLILLNIGMQLTTFEPSLWSGTQREPVSGALSLVLTLGFLFTWQKLFRFRPQEVQA